MTEPLEVQLKELFELKLEDIIKRKELVDIRLATDAEIEVLQGDILDGRIKGTIRQWHIVAVDWRGSFKSAAVLGYLAGTGQPYHTSEIAALNEGCSLVQTRNSLYGLGDPATGAVPLDLVWTACAMFHPEAQRILGIPAITF